MAPLALIDRTEVITRLNDRARLGLDRTARCVITRNCLATFGPLDGPQAVMTQARLLAGMRQCQFAPDSPERDLGSFTFEGRAVWVKVDYYDRNCEYGSEDPADASVTTRVVTIMLPEDW